MGADFMLAVVYIKHLKEEKGINYEARKKRMLEAIKEKEDFLSTEWAEWIDYKGLEEDSYEELIEELKEDIQNFISCLSGREVAYVGELGNYTCFGTGGMSWVDYPTDAPTYFNNINNLPNRFLEAGGIRFDAPSEIELILERDDLPPKLHEDLMAWKMAHDI